PCVFEVIYDVPSSVPATGVPLSYRFVMKIDEANKYKLAATPVTLVTADGPILSPGLYKSIYQQPRDLGGGSLQVDWNIALQVVETASTKIVQSSQPIVTNATLQCGAQAIPVVAGNVSLQAVGGLKQLQFSVSKMVSTQDHLDFGAATGFVKCYLNGTVTFDVTAGPSVSRPLSSGQGLEVLYPPVKQVP